MLLPRGAARLRDDLGAFLKARRQGAFGDEPCGTQAAVAARIGITRQTLSYIERGAAWPGPNTLDSLLDLLDLGWEDVAHPEPGYRRFQLGESFGGRTLEPAPARTRQRLFMEGKEANQLLAFGAQIRLYRKTMGLGLVVMAERAGVSAAFLSRLERGQIRRSRVFRFDRHDLDDAGYPKFIVLNAYLAVVMKATVIEGAIGQMPR